MDIDLSKYRSARDLLHFVLTECGDMTYIYDGAFTLNIYGASVRMNYIYYAIRLVKERFRTKNILFLKLYNLNNDTQIEYPEFLEQIEDLRDFICSYNTLTSLPNLPKNLRNLECQFNKLTELPELPNSLRTINCGHNKLTKLPELPSKLYYLSCYNNNIKTFPKIPRACNVNN